MNNSKKIRGQLVVDDRRRAVAALLLERGMTQTEIVSLLEDQGRVNPDGNPWTQKTVSNDIKALRSQWQEDAKANIAERHARMLKDVDAARRMAYEAKDVSGLIKVISKEAELTGLDQPRRLELSGPDGGPIETVSIEAWKAAAKERLELWDEN